LNLFAHSLFRAAVLNFLWNTGLYLETIIDCYRLSLYKTYVFSNFKFRYLQQAATCNVGRKLYYTAQSLVLDLQYAYESFSNS